MISQPAPAVTASSFELESAGTSPLDGDGRIPNPETPTGQPISLPSACAVRFTSGNGATSATLNQWIAAEENTITAPTVLCLSGTFTQPIHVWGKTTKALLEIAPTPGGHATLALGQVAAGDVDANQYWSDAGGISIVDSRSVEVIGLTIEGYRANGPGQVPAGIYVTTRSDTQTTNLRSAPHRSACFQNGGSCSDIFILDNTIDHIANAADSNSTDKSLCGNADVAAYGIAVIAAGSTSPGGSSTGALQHVAIEGNRIVDTRTGQSETVTLNGDLTDFVVADNIVGDADNIGIDTIGWETGASQARHGLIQDNTVYDVDTYSNSSYGHWTNGACAPGDENAAGIYDDGASYIWVNDNTVWNADQGINLDVETAHRSSDHLLVSGNTIHDDTGTAKGDPSIGTEPPGIGGRSAVAGHDPVALYIDAFGDRASITDVYVHDNVVQNESRYYLDPANGMPVVDIGGAWSNVTLWHNAIEGGGASDPYNPLMEIDQQPSGGANTIDCNDYRNLTDNSNSVNGNFALPDDSWLSLSQWQRQNGHGWDAHSSVAGFDGACPARSLP